LIRLLGTLCLLLALASVGCGGGEDGGGTAKEESVAPKPGSNVPEGGKTVVATVFEGGQKGIPADVGQWMVDIGVPRGDDLAFTVTKAITPSGNANFRLKNPQTVGHNLTIEEVDAVPVKEPFEQIVKTPVIRKGASWVRVPFWEGQHYVFYCSVPGHREAGMEGVIEVDSRLDAEDLKAF